MFRLKEEKEKWEPKLIHVFLEIIVSVNDSKTSTSYRVEIDTYDALKSLNGKKLNEETPLNTDKGTDKKKSKNSLEQWNVATSSK